MTEPAHRWARFSLAAALTAGGVWWLLRSSDPQSVLAVLESAHVEATCAAIGLLLASLMVKSLRWRLLLPADPISAPDAYRILHVAILVNNLLPLRAGDGVRVLSAPVRRVATVQQAIIALVSERVLDAGLLTIAALIVVPRLIADGAILDLPALPELPVLAVPLTAVAAVSVLSVPRVRSIARGVPDMLPGPRELLFDLRMSLTGGRSKVWRVLLLTVLLWSGAFTLHYILLEAIGVSASFELAIAVTMATNIALLVPATPAGIGTVHAAAAAPLLATGHSPELAVAYAILVHAANTIPPTLVGIACIAIPAASNLRPGRAA